MTRFAFLQGGIIRALAFKHPGHLRLAAMIGATVVAFLGLSLFGPTGWPVQLARAPFTSSTTNAGSSLTAASSFCSVTFDQASSAQGQASPISWTHTVGDGGTNRIIVVGVSLERETVSSVTWNGTNLSILGSRWDVDTRTRVEIWYLLAPATGSGTVQVNLSADTDVVGGATSWTCVDQSSPFSATSFVNGGSDTAITSLVSSSRSFVVDVMSVSDTITVGQNQTQRWNREQGGVTGGGSTEPGASNVTMSWSIGGNRAWAIGAASLRAVQ